MFCLKTALLNIKRRKQKSILVVLISLIIASFAFVYMSGIQTNQQQLDNLPQVMPVTARVTNLDGSQIVGLEITDALLDNILSSGYAKDLYYTVQLAAEFQGAPDEKDKSKRGFSIRAVNDINAIPNYQDWNIRLDGQNSLDFLRGNDANCIADDVWLQRNDLSAGDSIEIFIYGLEYNPLRRTFSFLPVGTCSLLIAGSMSPAGNSGMYMEILCPAGWARERFTEADVNFYPDSVVFTVADPLNLNAFKTAMKGFYLMSVDPTALGSDYGNSLSVHDEVFIKTATRLKSHLALLYGFAAVVFVIIASLGYALSYLFIQTRRTEVVLMRSLGASRKECVLVMFFEYAALGFIGSLLGMAGSVVFMGSAGAGPLLAFLMFFASFVLGIMAAAYQQSKWTAMSGLVKVEA